jgi:hypothetical protein
MELCWTDGNKCILCVGIAKLEECRPGFAGIYLAILSYYFLILFSL